MSATTDTRRGFMQLGLATAVASASIPVAAGEHPPSLAFLLIYRPGPAWPQGKTLGELSLSDHGRYMLDLYRRGHLHMAGGFIDDSGGAAVLTVADASQARAIADADPAVVAGLFIHELRPWRLVDWAALAAK